MGVLRGGRWDGALFVPLPTVTCVTLGKPQLLSGPQSPPVQKERSQEPIGPFRPGVAGVLLRSRCALSWEQGRGRSHLGQLGGCGALPDTEVLQTLEGRGLVAGRASPGAAAVLPSPEKAGRTSRQ